MNDIEKIENGKGTVYHELGHAFGYCLANSQPLTLIGNINLIEIGLSRNTVETDKHLYHFESQDYFKIKDTIAENTKNIERTIAWFIEVISGCTFQALFEGKAFKKCLEGPGQFDSNNLSAIRGISSFKWTFDDIFDLQKDYEEFLIRSSIIESFKTIVERIVDMLKSAQNHQIKFVGENLENLIEELNDLCSDEIIKGYLGLIEKYKLKFSN